MTADRIYHLETDFAYRVPEPRPTEPASLETPGITPAALSPEQLAEYLGISRSYVYQLMDRGELPWFRIGRLRKVLRRDADEFLQRLRDASRGAR